MNLISASKAITDTCIVLIWHCGLCIRLCQEVVGSVAVELKKSNFIVQY